MDPQPFASFHSSHIHAPYAVKDLVMTAELMRYTDSPDEEYAWTDQDTANLTGNLLIPTTYEPSVMAIFLNMRN